MQCSCSGGHSRRREVSVKRLGCSAAAVEDIQGGGEYSRQRGGAFKEEGDIQEGTHSRNVS